MKKLKAFIYNKTLYGIFIVVLFWYILHLTVSSSAIPSPYKTLLNFIEIFPGILSLHLSVSLARITTAILISLVFGSLIGLWIGMSEKADELITPIVYILYPLPKIAFLPILMILFGLGNTPKVVLIIIIIIFQIIVAARDGVREIPKELFYSVTSLGLNKSQTYRHLIIPAVLPKIITALRISVGVSISVLFFGENFATTYGIGYFIMNSWLMANYVEMFSGILSLSIMGFLIFKIIDILENKLCRWIKI
ncbi:NitT/TauT family transport system permease protein [Clostridium pascui]|uniref:ABC transporter permease n=1 Tax=Clostridium pascui TaxID=46609 RepID=UPI00195D53EB|nr:ABC transporter permease [Clostridium pascui]MBM7869798.1 NitT/TauT family transport system permease protein [Clostridium pascui]